MAAMFSDDGVPVRALIVDSLPSPLRVTPDGNVSAQQLQRIGPVDVQVCLQRNWPPVAAPVEGGLVRGRHGLGMSIIVIQGWTGGCNCPCHAADERLSSAMICLPPTEAHSKLGSREAHKAHLWSGPRHLSQR